MPKMGRYCKAYPIARFRQFEGWSEKAENARTETQEVDGKEREVVRELTGETFLYLQESYVVTDGIYLDQNIIFDDLTDEWKRFCEQELDFRVPEYEPLEIAPEGEAGQAGDAGPTGDTSGE